MMDLQVGSVNVEAALDRIKRKFWLIPKFQRDFVWEINDVISLVTSIFESRPIGMATLWTQAPKSSLELEPISLPDSNEKGVKYFSTDEGTPPQVYAVIDGKQRCTALAMAFGGFRPDNVRRKFAGRFFLSVNSHGDNPWEVIFKKESDVVKEGLNKEAACFSRGLFPLSSYIEGESFVAQWLRYVEQIDNKSNYQDSQLPSEEERARRKSIIKEAIQGLMDTKLATYTLPDRYTLSEICDIFQQLNTTGTKVSTVDLIHSWLYDESLSNGPTILLRDWIDSLGEKDGAIGWSSRSDRPELVAQIVTACYVALDAPPPARDGLRRGKASVTSVKSADLLSTPLAHWREVVQNDILFAQFLGDFQTVVAGGRFPYRACPYPVSAAIYVALRWQHRFEHASWRVEDLNAIFGAFFWRNALSQRYDQGFLTQLGTDLRVIKGALETRVDHSSSSSWVNYANKQLETLFFNRIPDKKDLIEFLTNGRPSGALFMALTLPLQTEGHRDIVTSNPLTPFPGNPNTAELHHIYPRQWCSDNKVGSLRNYLDSDISGRDWVESIVNLMPISRTSNNVWKTKNPAQFIREKKLDAISLTDTLKRMFIDNEGFGVLSSDTPNPGEFWQHRATVMADYFVGRQIIKI